MNDTLDAYVTKYEDYRKIVYSVDTADELIKEIDILTSHL